MSHFTERVLTEELAEAKVLLERALAILDQHEKDAATYSACDAIERLIGAPSTIEQLYIMMGKECDGSERI